jgi:hypothetical protein
VIRFLLGPNGKPRVEQIDKPPSVYLDHWALRTISSNNGLADEFAKILLDQNGTLLLSWLHLAEFSAVTDLAQARAAEGLVERVLPNVFFLEVNPFTVIERENVLMNGGVPRAPHADLGFLHAFVHIRPAVPHPFTASGLFSSVQSTSSSSKLGSLSSTITDRLQVMRAEYQRSAALRRSVLRLPSGPVIQRGTRVLLRELSRTFLIDANLQITANHAIDLVHAVVPTAYADYVLLDKHWEDQVERSRNRMTRAGLSIPIAAAFSGKKKGLERFLDSLSLH